MPWGDRRALESALREMDQLEREIQENYIYSRPGHSSSNPYVSSSSLRHHPQVPGAPVGGYFTPRYPPPGIRMARSNESETYCSSQSSDASPWSGYREATDYSSGQYSSGSAIPQSPRNYPERYYAPSLSSSNPSHRNSHSIEDSPLPAFQDASNYASRQASTSARGPADASSHPLSPSGQMQLVRYDDGHQIPSPDDDPDDQHYASETIHSPTSPQWSMNTTRGTTFSERSLSVASSQGIYSEDSALSGYTGVASSGYVESYDVASYDNYRGDYNHDSEDERDYMSDDIASDEGVYYSSSEGPDYEGDGDEVFSDGGYSDSYDGSFDESN
ncbi:hypothetical protein BDZ97DRAFT_237489 [Flammula alnicola]|nr:hypothetical protein BDZ97DRAFT_237489 [Flammula alnicola]